MQLKIYVTSDAFVIDTDVEADLLINILINVIDSNSDDSEETSGQDVDVLSNQGAEKQVSTAP